MTLADWVQTNGGSISIGVIDAMYARDPFWLERFGPTKLKFAHEDGGFHIRHLVSALRVGRDDVMENYGRWLREVLVSRGMCTKHLADNFVMLGDALKRSAPMDATPAVRALEMASAALAYIHNDARKLQDAATHLATQWMLRLGIAPTPELQLDALTVLSYAADAFGFASARPLAGFVAYRVRQTKARGLWARCSIEDLRRELVTVVESGVSADAAQRVDAAWA